MVEDATAVGVPEIDPFEVENDSPAGSAGEIDQEVAFPPLAVGITVVIATPLVSVNELGLYVIPDGAASLMRMVTVVVALPPVLVAVTV